MSKAYLGNLISLSRAHAWLSSFTVASGIDAECREASSPRSRSDYWEPKLKGNVARDAEHRAALQKMGFRVITVWECDIERNLEIAIAAVLAEISRQDGKAAAKLKA